MNVSPGRICLVTPGHLSTDPRLVKEADALTDAGYRVTTVSGRFIDWADEADREFDARPWTRLHVPFGPRAGRARWLRQGIACRRADALYRLGMPPRAYWREEAFHPVVRDLSRVVRGLDADLFIGHNLAGLIAAGRAAQSRGALLGFDAEDDHVGELPHDRAHAPERARREAIHRRWLPRCVHLTAAAPLMAAQLRGRYGREFVPVLNVSALGRSPAPAAAPSEPSLSWFSQTVGAGRGLEQIIRILSVMRTPALLALRGRCAAGYDHALLACAARHGVDPARIRFEPPTAPSNLPGTLARHSLGLSTEVVENENKAVCLGNKIFQYLAAGVPVLLSRTPAQDDLARHLGAAGLSVDLEDPGPTAACIDRWLGNASHQAQARAHARCLASQRYNWERERSAFLESVSAALGTNGP